MDADLKRQMNVHAEEQCRQVCMSLAAGNCVDEGDDDHPAIVKTSRSAARWLLENPPVEVPEPYRSALRKLAGADARTLRSVCDAFADGQSIPGIVTYLPMDDLSTAEFLQAFVDGTADLVAQGLNKIEAETEWFWQYAEEQTQIRRVNPPIVSAAQKRLKKAKNAAYQRVYNNLP